MERKMLMLKPVRIWLISGSEYGQSSVTISVERLCVTNHKSRK